MKKQGKIKQHLLALSANHEHSSFYHLHLIGSPLWWWVNATLFYENAKIWCLYSKRPYTFWRCHATSQQSFQFIQTHLTNKVVLFHRWPWPTIGTTHRWATALGPIGINFVLVVWLRMFFVLSIIYQIQKLDGTKLCEN